MRIAERKLSDYPFGIRIIFWFQELKYGHSLVPSKIWGRVPALMFGLQFFYRALDRKRTLIEPSLRSLISIRVSKINQCAFCTDIAVATLNAQGISVQKISEVETFQSSTLFTEAERSVLNYAEKMTFSDQNVRDADIEQLKRFFSEDQIVELTAIVAFQNMSSKFNAALDIPAQGFCSIENKKGKP